MIKQSFSIAASLLNANFACIGQEATQVLLAGANRLHLDMMDNHYVPQLTFGPLLCKALRNLGIRAPIDVHLMVELTNHLIDEVAAAGATTIIVHPDACAHLETSLEHIKQQGCQAGLAISPSHSIQKCEHVLAKLSVILILAVQPGWGGQSFILETLQKITQLAQWLEQQQHSIDISVDGGVTPHNIAQIAHAGAHHFVIGSAIFSKSDYRQAILDLRQALS